MERMDAMLSTIFPYTLGHLGRPPWKGSLLAPLYLLGYFSTFRRAELMKRQESEAQGIQLHLN